MMSRPKISVIIPTVNRSAVRAAVLSALNQNYAPYEVIVAVDRSDNQVPQVLYDLCDKIRVVFSGGVGPSGARMHAVSESSGEIIAFLDDDDQWYPEKLERQVAMWSTGDAKRHRLLSCRFVMIGADGKTQRALPARLIAPDERLAAYLFRRTSIGYWEGAIHPSTLMCDRDLLTKEPWDASTRLHEDWEWMLRVGARSDVEILMSPDVLVEISTSDKQSLSRAPDWRLSFSWVQENTGFLRPREIGDFLLGYTAVMAIWSGNRRASLRVAWYALRKAKPGLHSWLVWMFNLLPPMLVNSGSNLLHRLVKRNAPAVEQADLTNTGFPGLYTESQ
jgi:glycosyltransferase involved in cell wall biosynthesis